MTEQQIQERLNQYLEAERKILQNQSYTIGSRTFTRANMQWIQEGIEKLQQQLAIAGGAGTIRIRKAIFRDD